MAKFAKSVTVKLYPQSASTVDLSFQNCLKEGPTYPHQEGDNRGFIPRRTIGTLLRVFASIYLWWYKTIVTTLLGLVIF